MPLQVIGAGFGRTSTHSLYLALEILGYNTSHMVNLGNNENYDLNIFNRAFDDPNHEDEWEKIYGDYQAAVDFPICVFYKELSEKYPDAKFILTVRSAESWFKSIHKTIFKDFKEQRRELKGRRKEIYDMLLHVCFGGILEKDEDKMFDEAYMCKIFNDHIEDVKRTIPKERLLIMNMGDGWKPLCEFLEKPVPDQPYPVSNSSVDFEQVMKDARTKFGNKSNHTQ
ncbi:unnamed protein product [Cunninghamella blakesleeana]